MLERLDDEDVTKEEEEKEEEEESDPIVEPVPENRSSA
jgi:hypothetical protein